MCGKFPGVWLLVCLSLFIAGPGFAQQPTAPAPPSAPEAEKPPTKPVEARPAKLPKGGKVSLNFKDIELTDLIQTISELTGKNFIYDETVRGKATVISPEPMSLDQAYNVFLTVLAVKGYTVVPSGKVNKVIPVRDAKESNLPTFTKALPHPAEEYITRLIPLVNTDAATVATTIAPLVSKTSSIVAYPPANTLIITDNASNIDRLVKIIKELDVSNGPDLMEIIPLQYADATELATLLNQILTQGTPAAPVRRRATRNVQTAGGQPETSKVLPYPRTNTVVVLATAEDMNLIRHLVAELDKKPAQEHAGIYVYYLENADAETLATTLNQIVTGIKAQPRGAATRPGQPAPARTPAAAGQQPQALGSVAITADKPTNSLIVNSTPEDYDTIKGIIAQLDVKRQAGVRRGADPRAVHGRHQKARRLPAGSAQRRFRRGRHRHQQPEPDAGRADQSRPVRRVLRPQPADPDAQRHPARRHLQPDHRHRSGRQGNHRPGPLGPDRYLQDRFGRQHPLRPAPADLGQ